MRCFSLLIGICAFVLAAGCDDDDSIEVDSGIAGTSGEGGAAGSAGEGGAAGSAGEGGAGASGEGGAGASGEGGAGASGEGGAAGSAGEGGAAGSAGEGGAGASGEGGAGTSGEGGEGGAAGHEENVACNEACADLNTHCACDAHDVEAFCLSACTADPSFAEDIEHVVFCNELYALIGLDTCIDECAYVCEEVGGSCGCGEVNVYEACMTTCNREPTFVEEMYGEHECNDIFIRIGIDTPCSSDISCIESCILLELDCACEGVDLYETCMTTCIHEPIIAADLYADLTCSESFSNLGLNSCVQGTECEELCEQMEDYCDCDQPQMYEACMTTCKNDPRFVDEMNFFYDCEEVYERIGVTEDACTGDFYECRLLCEQVNESCPCNGVNMQTSCMTACIANPSITDEMYNTVLCNDFFELFDLDDCVEELTCVDACSWINWACSCSEADVYAGCITACNGDSSFAESLFSIENCNDAFEHLDLDACVDEHADCAYVCHMLEECDCSDADADVYGVCMTACSEDTWFAEGLELTETCDDVFELIHLEVCFEEISCDDACLWLDYECPCSGVSLQTTCMTTCNADPTLAHKIARLERCDDLYALFDFNACID